jgi:hypothetical protein
VVLLVAGGIAAYFFVRDTVDEAIDDGGLAFLPGGDCLEFQLAFSSLMLTDTFAFAADEAQRRELDEGLEELRAMVPGDIADDFAVVSDAFGQAMRVGLSGSASGDPAAEAEVQALLESPEVQQAQASINAWLEDNCT